jgi:hypothetical protein
MFGLGSPPLAPTRSHPRATQCHSYPSRANKPQRWTLSDDLKLNSLVRTVPTVDWPFIASHFPDKTHQQVVERWRKVIDPTLTKGSWTGEEDQAIVQFVQANGAKSWSKLAAMLPGRIGKQCRERWINHLNPEISHAAFTPEDDKMIVELHGQFGNKWAKIAAIMRTRSCNAIKNRWNSVLAKAAERTQPPP